MGIVPNLYMTLSSRVIILCYQQMHMAELLLRSRVIPRFCETEDFPCPFQCILSTTGKYVSMSCYREIDLLCSCYSYNLWSFLFCFLNPHPSICLLLWEREWEREKHQSVVSCICPDQELNLQHFGVWDDALSDWATWPVHKFSFLSPQYHSWDLRICT